MKYLKIVLAVIFVLLIAFFAARGFIGYFKRHEAGDRVGATHWVAPTRIAAPKPGTPLMPAPVARAKMAIILDDWGNSSVLLKSAIAIHRPLTLSVLPHLPFSTRISEEAKKNGLGVMLHMPMQAKNPNQPKEPQTILTTTPDAEIVKYLDGALSSVHGAEGVNNHQGSAATSDRRVMKTVLGHLKERDLFFVDSEVISTSVGEKTAKAIGIPFAKRQVFLDNEATVEAVKAKLRQAEKIALKHGQVIAIGHDKKATLEAIRQTVPELEKHGVKLVLAKELVK